MDETGQSGDTGSADSGAGADSRDRTLLNGWATSDSPWSSAGAALDPSSEVPAWRRPSAELRTPPDFRPSGEIGERPSGDFGGGPDNRPGETSRPPSEPRPSTELRPSVEVKPGGESHPAVENASAPRWSDSRSRYADLLAHLSPTPNGVPSANGADPGRPVGEETRPVDLRSVSGELPPISGETRPAAGHPRPVDVGGPRIPTSAPPYPYEGDLDDEPPRVRPAITEQRAAMPLDRPSSLDRPASSAPPSPFDRSSSLDRPASNERPAVFGRPAHLEPPSAAERQAIPLVRPATPGGRTSDWAAAESARHAIEQVTPPDGMPYISRRDAGRRAQEAGPSAGQPVPSQPGRPGSGLPADGPVRERPGAVEPGPDLRGTDPAADRPASGPPGPAQPAPSGAGRSDLGRPGSGQAGFGQTGAGQGSSGQAGAGPGAAGRAVRDESTSGPAEPDEGPRRVPESLAPGLADPIQPRPPYDPSTFPRRLPYETPHARPTGATQRPAYGSGSPTGAPLSQPPAAAYSGIPAGEPSTPTAGERPTRALPQRVPAKPDVPTVPEPPSVEPPAETPALARIATHLRRGDVVPPQERQEGFDVTAILAAVREVDGVRGASLRTTPAGAHSLRLDLADGADPAEVSRQVARLLQDRMGLDAAMQAPDNGPTDELPSVASYAPAQPVPAGRAPVSGAGIGGVAAVSAADTAPGGPTGPGPERHCRGSRPGGRRPPGAAGRRWRTCRTAVRPRSAPPRPCPPRSGCRPVWSRPRHAR